MPVSSIIRRLPGLILPVPLFLPKRLQPDVNTWVWRRGHPVDGIVTEPYHPDADADSRIPAW